MNRVADFLMENPVIYLSTVESDGTPRCRPFQFATNMDGKLWFCTNSEKKVFKELEGNPKLEICVASPQAQWVRISGKAVFEDNLSVKEKCMEMDLVKSIYKSADNPIFRVFYIGEGQATISDFSGEPPVVINL